MLAYHERYGIPWDQDWVVRNYLDKENLIAVKGDEPIGFISLERCEHRLHVHTLQILGRYQNERAGLYILRQLVQLMRNGNMHILTCKVFKDHPAQQIYARLGFIEIASEGVLVDMERGIDPALLRYVSRCT